MKFYNPYHFLPVNPGPRQDDIPVTGLASTPKLNHASYAAGLYSGEVECTLETMTPTFVGSEQSPRPGEPTRVSPYGLGDWIDGLPATPAIPGSSLRGMISSIAEAATNSALRVLDARSLSFHKSMKDPSLSAIGQARNIRGKWYIQPLAMPFLRSAGRGQPYQLAEPYRRYFPVPMLRYYRGDRNEITNSAFAPRTGVQAQYRLRALTWGPTYTLPRDTFGDLYEKRDPSGDGRSLLAQKESADAPLRAGVYRVLGCWGDRLNEIPRTKKHELFLPYPVVTPQQVAFVPLPDYVVARFEQLCDERTEESVSRGAPSPLLPFHPLSRPRNAGSDGDRIRLQDGDLVYFGVSPDGRAADEISFSAIWRSRPENTDHTEATPWDFFRAVGADLVPFDKTRTQLTPAEQLFGFVASEVRPDGVSALAGRLRFSDALPAENVDFARPFGPEVPLKILSSPKPPCPAMYFRPNAQGRRVRKSELRPATSPPQGRKVYLHHRLAANEAPWVTGNRDHADQKMAIRPMRQGLKFEFTVRFDNLTSRELDLLLYSLRPAPAFMHKLGLGKPLGLGSVQLEVRSVGLVDRKLRYCAAGLMAPRHSCQLNAAQVSGRVTSFRNTMNADIRRAIDLTGTLPTRAYPIHTPQVEDLNLEQETFTWFVANDSSTKAQNPPRKIREQARSLPPLTSTTTELPALDRFPWEPA